MKKKKSNNTVNCYFFLFFISFSLPEKAQADWNHSYKNYKNAQLERSHTNDDNEVDVLYKSIDHEVLDLNMTNTEYSAENTRF
ncbi:hypothetical protein EV44_g0269 [Erysiphe necator]|uniref:Uncharacterized protein n=1 Tax=Uncinula necator TaxID=52586 RepID=A0A0B1PG87_UNCNE|nr:hypothetical protein EV44_g0269 [Erysiphe necator]